MVVLYTTASCASCRKAKAWLEENQIDYTENIVSNSMTVDELKSILRLTEGATEIISTRSKTFQDLNINIEELSLNEFYKLIIEHPLCCVVQLCWTRKDYRLVLMTKKFVNFTT